ncbi:MAG: hypothetical protein BA861_08485 [Desulfobacterales bacterium S3730MH5]|nr:MAG: hypothetical protein BA861_08485 [Desulfobacterales bacterium S3730MH5]
MKIFEQDAKLFFDLMWALQFFANQKLKILTNVKSLDDYAECSAEEKFEVRKALYGDTKLIASFVQENPENFSEEKLSIVSDWKNFIEGGFHIERFLKRYAVFIKDADVYGVMGLYQGFDELVDRSQLPLYVQTVLLPFKGKIVYDGFFQVYNVHFGGGIKRGLRESYMTAKQNSRIIESFEPTQKGTQKKKPSKPLINWMPELNELAGKAKKLRGSSEHPAIYGLAFSLVKASIEFAQIAVSDSDDLAHLCKSLRKVERALSKSNTVLNREEY